MGQILSGWAFGAISRETTATRPPQECQHHKVRATLFNRYRINQQLATQKSTWTWTASNFMFWNLEFQLEAIESIFFRKFRIPTMRKGGWREFPRHRRPWKSMQPNTSAGCAYIPRDCKMVVLTLAAGSGLGQFVKMSDAFLIFKEVFLCFSYSCFMTTIALIQHILKITNCCRCLLSNAHKNEQNITTVKQDHATMYILWFIIIIHNCWWTLYTGNLMRQGVLDKS